MQNSSAKHNRVGVEILVRGTVQGVGFRPFVYKLASRLAISGTVTNTSDGVVILAFADTEKVDLFIQAIGNEAPPLARITAVETKVAREDFPGDSFSILPSTTGESSETSIPPDISICSDCRSELDDPADRRYQYPFTNCTNCGPRFSIVTTIPYDRPNTSMHVFPMCDRCASEYSEPMDRRFHAQPNGCPVCGPAVSLHAGNGNRLPGPDALALAANLLAKGRIIAIKGLGGFHLAVDACSTPAVARLRERKNRPDKPFAVMAADLPCVKNICSLSPHGETLLLSPEHPIVLLPKNRKSRLAENLAPGIDDIGVMLPYTPLHHVLFQQPGCPEVLVMTSGNLSGRPICTANEEALDTLPEVCDNFLLHNREIVTRVDDSVVKIAGDGPIIFRRARGFVPAPVEIPWTLPKTLGCGGGLKSTFSLGQNRTVWTSQHIGDLDNLESYEFYRESILHFKKLLRFEPEISVCDLHPDYLSSHYATQLGLPLYRVQHHHAHAVAVMAEHGLEGQAVSIVLDGTGLGDDGSIWGGEILLTDLTSFERVGHFSQLRMPGGDAAAVEPWRMGLSALFTLYGEDGLHHGKLPHPLRQADQDKLSVISSMLSSRFNSPLCSSCGRLFDAVASLLGLRQISSYEGQAAMELESLARRGLRPDWIERAAPAVEETDGEFIRHDKGQWEIRTDRLLQKVLGGLERKSGLEIIAAEFHIMVIVSLVQATNRIAANTGVDHVVLAGGCLQNVILLEGLNRLLRQAGYRVFTGNSLPVNDGGISFGQAVTGGLRHVSGNSHAGDRGSGRPR